MDDLKRWREERAGRQTARILKGYVESNDSASRWRPFDLGSHAAQVVRWVSITREAQHLQARREIEAVKALGPIDDNLVEKTPGGFRVWPKPPPVSPVHPEWDDPTGRRFKMSFYQALALHVILIPGFLLLSSIRFTLDDTGIKDTRLIGVAIARPLLGGGARPKPPVEQPKADPPKPNPPSPKPPATKPQNTKPTPTKPTVKPPDPSVAHNYKAAKQDSLKRNQTPPRANPDVVTKAPADDPEPVTDPPASEGDLLASGDGPVPGSGTGIGSVDGVDFPYNRYLENIRSMVGRAWKVPESYVSKGRHLETVVRFKINRDGTPAESSVEEASNFAFYDQAALRAVVSIKHFPPLPQEFGGQFLVVHFQFTYTGR